MKPTNWTTTRALSPSESDAKAAGVFEANTIEVTAREDAANARDWQRQLDDPAYMLRKLCRLATSYKRESEGDQTRRRDAVAIEYNARKILKHLHAKDRDPLALLAPMFLLGHWTATAKFRPFDAWLKEARPHIARGRKVLRSASEGGRAKNEQLYGVNRAEYRAALVEYRRVNPNVSLTEARKRIAAQFGVCRRTLERNTEDLFK